MVLPLPMIKLGGLIVRTLTKPLAKAVKTRSKVDPALNAVCNSLGQSQHRLLIRFHMGYRGVSNFIIKDLPADQAVEKGADLIGELIIFSVAVGVASFEYQRSATKSKDKERAEAEAKRLQEEATEARFEDLEQRVIWLEAQLATLGRMVEHDLDKRIEEAEGGAVTTVLTPPPPRHRTLSSASDASTVSVTSTPSTAGDASGSRVGSALGAVWTATYNSVASLFR